MTDDRMKSLIDEIAGRFGAGAPLVGREEALDGLLGVATTRFLQAVASLSKARVCLRAGNAEEGVRAVLEYQDHMMAGLTAMKRGGALYAVTPRPEGRPN